MRNTRVLSGVLLALLSQSAMAQEGCHSGFTGLGPATFCGAAAPHVIRFEPPPADEDAAPLHLATAVLGGPPLVWYPDDSALHPPPGPGTILGRTIPIDRVIGRHVTSLLP